MNKDLSLTPDELQACLEAMQFGHHEDDFEPECPGCNARVKLVALIEITKAAA